MAVTEHFSTSYEQARRRFLEACRDAGAQVTSHTNPDAVGPAGQALATDVARLGEPDGPLALVLVSGTHGIEGFAGSACQLRCLREGVGDASALTVYLVHALNPFGFAHERRVNEHNVDVNRNFVDHDDPPSNPAYAEVHDLLLPARWEGSEKEGADRALAALAAEHGLGWLQEAVTRGQWTHPDGLFYGGAGPQWSNRMLRAFARAELGGHERVAVIDFHTGLGDPGGIEIIFRGRPGTDEERLARAWYGSGVTSSERGDSSSTVIVGNTPGAFREELDGAQVVPVTLEFGTYEPLEVLEALRGEQWLALHPGAASDAVRTRIRARFREAFCCDSEAWREGVLRSGERIVRAAASGLGR